MNLFSSNVRGAIGLDLSDHSLEAVQLNGAYNKKNYRLIGWARMVLKAGILNGGYVVKQDEFREAVRALLSKPTFGSLEGRQLICSIPEHHCYHYIFTISKWATDKSPLAQVVENLTSKLPLTKEEVYWDWKPVREDARYTYVYVVAMPREVIDGYRQVFNTMGLTMIAAEPQALCAARTLWPSLVQESPTVIIDIGATETTVATVDDLGIHQNSIVAQGADHWTRALVKELSLTEETAEKVSRTIGLRQVKHPKAEVIRKQIQQGLLPIIAEAKQHMMFYHSQTHIQAGVLKQLVVIGGGAAVPGVTEFIGHELALSTTIQPPWFELKPPFDVAQRLLLTNALGAAMRGLMPEDMLKGELNVFATRRELASSEKTGGLSRLTQLFRGKRKP